MNKLCASPEEAVADIPDGSTIAIAGFGIGHRFPSSLITALRDKGTKKLCIVCNSVGGGGQRKAEILVKNHQVSKLIAAFSARAGGRSPTEDQIASGEIEMELVPQGTLVERCRAGGAGLAAFYTPTGVGTAVAEGKEVRNFDGKDYILEKALRLDYAFVRAYRADKMGNLQFRGGSQNFNPSFAKSARIAIAEAEEVVEIGEIKPEDVDLPGIFVTRVIQSTLQAADLEELKASKVQRRPAESARLYFGKPALTRLQIAERAAALLASGSTVNLGAGLPTLVSNFLRDRNVMLHAENGIVGYGRIVTGDEIDPDHFNAGGQFVSLLPGASFCDSVTSFEIARSGKLAAVILGAYQVDQNGGLANWSTPDMTGGGIGGAMDLVAGETRLIVVMEHRDSKDRAKLLGKCTYPLTRDACVSSVVTDLALFTRKDGGFVLEEVAPGFTPQEVMELTDMNATIAPTVGVMKVSA